MPKVTQEELEAIESEMEDTEAEKEARRAERAERKRLKALAKKRELQQKFIAPALLLVSILVSALVFWLSKQ